MAFCEFGTCVRALFLAVGLMALASCAMIGPQSITAGRGTYAEVINSTEDEQILTLLVRQRYHETFGMLSVSNVTANLRFTTQAGANFGVGNSANYAGNLVPLSAGVAFEENPTISYTPLSGKAFMQRMLEPLTIQECLLLSGLPGQYGFVFDVAVHRVNRLRNPFPGEEPRSPRYERFIELYGRLRRAAVLDVVAAPAGKDEYEFLFDIHDYDPAHGDSVREFLHLLGIETKVDGDPILLPIVEAVGESTSSVHVQARSPYDVLRSFGTGVELPCAHVAAGVVQPLEHGMHPGRSFITIRSSSCSPRNATVRVRFRDQWFYVDATDTRSKQAFLFLRNLIGIRFGSPEATKAPVVTVPVR